MSGTSPPTPRDHITMVDHDYSDCSEDVSLIGADREHRRSSTPDGLYQHKINRHYNPLYIAVVASLTFLITDIAGQIIVAPRLAIFEHIICKAYYTQVSGAAGTGMGDCKVEPVQSELALINGWREMFDNIPAIAVSIPYGVVADRFGRKKVLLIAMVGCLLSDIWVGVVTWFPDTFPLRAVWFSGIWQLIGGGGASISSMAFAMIADSCPADLRTTAFSQVHAAVLVAELVSVPAGAALANFNPWIPVFGAAIFMVLGILFAYVVVPDVRPAGSKSEGGSDGDFLSSAQESHPTWLMSIHHRWRKIVDEFRKDSSWIRDVNVLLIMASFFVCQLGRMISGITLQYAAAKFHWKFDKASLLVSLRAGVNLFVLAAIIPALSYILVKRFKLNDVVKDKRITQINGVCLIIGSFVMFLAASPGTLVFGQTVFALGFAFSVTARSFLTGMVDPMHIGTVFTGVTTMLYGGLVIGSPMLAKTLQWGLQLGGIWVGLPFLLAAVLFTLALGAISAARSY
ncbi:major facilitator superfamily domain-containing protein [Aspergillus flavus]|uniref:Major facilitator superfamily domain-containing protein n=1 Tax=Aspergillus flavus TaxID=5059 RepID=A0A5N6HEK8_ASPFL|nr:major facilitator superfamily domain-containing protein [Aspergillus flavus]RAQ69440.1 MFS multidrug transporter [Aspergillus flavus]RAQ80469.1 MFS multidrug transporter [Aspergillus flavus]